MAQGGGRGHRIRIGGILQENQEPLAAGFGCYSLSLIACRTGGKFFILSRQVSEYKPERLRSYAPEWCPPDEYKKRTDQSKLRTAIVDTLDDMTDDLPSGAGFTAEGDWPMVKATFEGETVDTRATIGAPPLSLATPPSSLVEPLSDRELQVLHLLSGGQTNQEIARTLCVSINTVKTHLKNVYGKLGVSSRRQATAKGKELGLLS